MESTLKRADVLLMAFCTGLIVANIYYCQPLVILMAKDFSITETVAGRISYITQAGYAIGLFFLVPLGDMFERKKQILTITFAAAIFTLLAAIAPNLFLLQAASLFIGITSIVPQLILPMAANLSDESQRGQNVGIIMSGLLVGILASRSVSGSLGFWLGWRAVFYMATGICILLWLLMAKRFPNNKPTFAGTYKQLMSSMFGYVKSQPVLRQASIISFIAFAVIMAFWTTMVLYLSNAPFNFNASQVGLFGIAGAAGALAAPLVGKSSGKRAASTQLMIGFALELLSVALFYFTGKNIFLFIMGIVLIDIGQQVIHVTNQTRIYTILPEARNRFNTIYMSVSFVGASMGSAFGLWLWDLGRWNAFCYGVGTLIVLNFGLVLWFKNRTSNG